MVQNIVTFQWYRGPNFCRAILLVGSLFQDLSQLFVKKQIIGLVQICTNDKPRNRCAKIMQNSCKVFICRIESKVASPVNFKFINISLHVKNIENPIVGICSNHHKDTYWKEEKLFRNTFFHEEKNRMFHFFPKKIWKISQIFKVDFVGMKSKF